MKMNIDLGTGGEESVPATKSKPSEKYYPTITYSGDEEMTLPEEGEMKVEFRKVRSSSTTREDGKTTYDCTLEIRKIIGLDVDAGDVTPPASNKHKDAGSALDALVADYVKSKKAY